MSDTAKSLRAKSLTAKSHEESRQGGRWENPMQTDGFEFVEFTSPQPEELGRLFGTLGFTAIARHRSKDVTLYRQGDINFILNAEREGFPQAFTLLHGPSVCAIAFRVKDAAAACGRARSEEHTSELQSLMRHSYAAFC